MAIEAAPTRVCPGSNRQRKTLQGPSRFNRRRRTIILEQTYMRKWASRRRLRAIGIAPKLLHKNDISVCYLVLDLRQWGHLLESYADA